MLFPESRLRVKMSKNPLTLIMETNKLNSTNYNNWLRILRIVLDFENQSYVLDKPLPTTSPKEPITFEKCLEDNRKVCSIILALMTNDIQKQYDRLEDVPSIMLRTKEVYAVPDRHIRYARTKAFLGTKMAEGLSVQSYGVKMLSLVEKLEDLKAGLDTDTYIDERLQPPRRKARGLDAERGRRERKRSPRAMLTPRALLLPQLEMAKGKGRLEVLSGRRKMMFACIAKERGIGRGSAHNSYPTQVLERSRK
ncbi:hypothetical protein Sango_0263700 [Sesamum angolense]|uniref:Uncharacterized protein n=1 Tax=Sesamum angolense TaxID=2727404 RepID=A0AAE1XHD0_9LAMI|nr:hypothetical protein Sango_0263700 [Sesamum angolense]